MTDPRRPGQRPPLLQSRVVSGTQLPFASPTTGFRSAPSPSAANGAPVWRRAWYKACLAVALLSTLQVLPACSAQQPARSTYERQAEMDNAALAALEHDRSYSRQADPEESGQPSPAHSGTADVIGQMGVALLSVLMTIGNALLMPLLLL
jgi:hypothetical protein